MAYTEIKEKNNKKYFYRVRTIRQNNKFKKERIYLGRDLSKAELSIKEQEADKKLMIRKISKEIEKLKPKIVLILKKNNVIRAGIFGSYARGEQKKNSDIDILIEINNPNITLLGFIKIKHKLEDVLKKKVDLVEYEAIKPLIKKRVLDEEIRIIWKEIQNCL